MESITANHCQFRARNKRICEAITRSTIDVGSEKNLWKSDQIFRNENLQFQK